MLTVFYGEQVWGTYQHWGEWRNEEKPTELYNGAYVYNNSPSQYQSVWSRADGVPCLDEHVPEVLRTMVLLLE